MPPWKPHRPWLICPPPPQDQCCGVGCEHPDPYLPLWIYGHRSGPSPGKRLPLGFDPSAPDGRSCTKDPLIQMYSQGEWLLISPLISSREEPVN